MAPSLVPLKWRRTQASIGFAMAASGFAQEGQLAHNNNSLDPMCGLCKVQDATSILRHEEANQYIDSGQCDEYLFSS